MSTRVNCLTNNRMTFVVTFLYNFWTVVKAQTRPSERLQQCNILTLIRTRKLAFRCEPDPMVKSVGTHIFLKVWHSFQGQMVWYSRLSQNHNNLLNVTFCVMVIFKWEILIIWKKIIQNYMPFCFSLSVPSTPNTIRSPMIWLHECDFFFTQLSWNKYLEI